MLGVFIGMKKLSEIEKKDSRIKWTKVDPLTVQKLKMAIIARKKADRLPIWLTIYIGMILNSFAFLVLGIFLLLAKERNTPYWISGVFISAFAIFYLVVIISIIREKNHIYIKKQSDIWIFRAKCAEAFEGTTTSSMPKLSSSNSGRTAYYAWFNKGGDRFRIEISKLELDSRPVGEEYIFYKFNDRRGNQWMGIPTKHVDI